MKSFYPASEISTVKGLIAEVAATSNEQLQGISQINQTLLHADHGVQTGIVSAESGAATALELANQGFSFAELAQVPACLA